jgi:hypothetical protein
VDFLPALNVEVAKDMPPHGLPAVQKRVYAMLGMAVQLVLCAPLERTGVLG